MEAICRYAILSAFAVICLLQLTEGQPNPYAWKQTVIMPPIPQPVGNVCRSWFGCNKHHTRCMDVADGCDNGDKGCQCKEGTIDVNGVCLRYREVNSGCDTTKDLCPAGATCTAGKCTCPNGVHSDDEEVCGRRHGEKCNSNSECNQERGHQMCSSGQCVCVPGTEYVKEMGKWCLPVSGNTCTKDSQCYGGTWCIGGICKCPSSNLKFDTAARRCVGANALTDIPKGDECSMDQYDDKAKVCAIGLHCYPCNPYLGVFKCVKVRTSGSANVAMFLPVLVFAALISFISKRIM